MNTRTPDRPKGRRLGRAVLMLLALVVVAVFVSEGVRVAALRANAQRLDNAMQKVDLELLHGGSAADFYRNRVIEANGWHELKPLHEFIQDANREDAGEGLEPARAKRTRAMRALVDYYEESGKTDPPTEQLWQWLNDTQDVADSIRAAAQYAVVVPVPEPGSEEIPYAGGINVIPRLDAFRASLGRCFVWVELGSPERAEQELLDLAKVWAAYRQPAYLVDALVNAAGIRIISESALKLLRQGQVSQDVALMIAAVPLDPIQDWQAAMAGEVVWISNMIQRSAMNAHRHGWFSWLWPTPDAEDLIWLEAGGGLKARIIGPLDMTRMAAVTLEGNLVILRRLSHPLPWPELEGVDPEYERSVFSISSQFMQDRLLRHWVVAHDLIRLELEVLRQRHGDLHEQREAVESAVAARQGVTVRWDGDTPVLGLRALTSHGQAGNEFETRLD